MEEVESALVLVRMDPSELDLVTLFERLGFDLDLLDGVDQSVGDVRTRDMGGQASTVEFSDALVRALG